MHDCNEHARFVYTVSVGYEEFIYGGFQNITDNFVGPERPKSIETLLDSTNPEFEKK